MKNSLCFLFLATVLAASLSCRKEASNHTIPDVSVDIYIYINNPSYIDLTVVGGWKYVPGGIRGVLVYRKSNSEFIAFERNCTYQPDEPCSTVIVDKNNIVATDTCCRSEFLLTDGSVIKAPASLPLKVYRHTFDGNVLHIYN
jgi:nitrite reductase/ring-hydroxylating ferredoxin subunit